MKHKTLRAAVKPLRKVKGKLNKRVADAQRRASKFAAGRLSKSFAGTALRSVILDGRTLNIDVVPASDEWRDAEIWIADRSGRKIRRLETVKRPGGNITATTDLTPLGGAKRARALPVQMVRGDRTGPIKYSGEADNPNSGVVHLQPEAECGEVRRSVVRRYGERLAVRIAPAKPAVHVSKIDTSLYRLRVEFTCYGGTLTGLRCKLRNSEVSVEHRALRGRGDNRWSVDLDLESLAQAAQANHIASPSVWDVTVEFNGEWRPARMTASDLVNPRWVVRYVTVSFKSRNGWNRFRPYWTLGGNLAIEHFSLFYDAKGVR